MGRRIENTDQPQTWIRKESMCLTNVRRSHTSNYCPNSASAMAAHGAPNSIRMAPLGVCRSYSPMVGWGHAQARRKTVGYRLPPDLCMAPPARHFPPPAWRRMAFVSHGPTCFSVSISATMMRSSSCLLLHSPMARMSVSNSRSGPSRSTLLLIVDLIVCSFAAILDPMLLDAMSACAPLADLLNLNTPCLGQIRTRNLMDVPASV